MLLKNSSGQKSASFTMMIVGFIVVTLWLLVSIVAKVGHIEIREFSGSEAMAYFSPLAALYFGRRWQDGRQLVNGNSSTDSSEAAK
jgi:hypothetical protein